MKEGGKEREREGERGEEQFNERGKSGGQAISNKSRVNPVYT